MLKPCVRRGLPRSGLPFSDAIADKRSSFTRECEVRYTTTTIVNERATAAKIETGNGAAGSSVCGRHADAISASAGAMGASAGAAGASADSGIPSSPATRRELLASAAGRGGAVCRAAPEAKLLCTARLVFVTLKVEVLDARAPAARCDDAGGGDTSGEGDGGGDSGTGGGEGEGGGGGGTHLHDSSSK